MTQPSQEFAEDVFAFPMSYAQRRLWFLDQLEPGGSTYNVPVVFRLSGRLDVKGLAWSLNEIVRRHEALRTTFTAVDGQPVQVIAPSLTLALPVVDLGELPEGEREAEALRVATEEARRPFNLAEGPLVRAMLVRLREEEHLLALVMHHIVSDGWSMGVFLREWAALYHAFCTGHPSPLEDLPIQYADFAVWQRGWLQGEVLETQLAYWEGQLEGAPVLELPTDRPRPAVQTYRGTCQSQVLSEELTEALRALSRQKGVTLFMTLLAAFEVLLYRYTGQEDVAVGTPIANRTRTEIEGLIGFFVNTLVLRTDLSGDPTFRELLGRVREVALGAYAHQDLPFEKLVEELQPERNLSHSPLFQVMFALQSPLGPSWEFAGLRLEPVDVHSGTAKFDLSLTVVEGPEGLREAWEYNTDLFEATTVERMVGHFRVLLESIVADPDGSISSLPLLTEGERHQLLVEWNDTQVECPKELCVHQLFEAQVERAPDAVAVVFENQQLTYRELNERANQLAHYLRALGVGPEVLVGICVDRSLEMVVGVLGTLKAGGAYVPLDPAYPQERLAFMLQDTRTPVLLTQERLLNRLPEYQSRAICLDSDWEVVSRESRQNPTNQATPDSLCYVIYTSGSAGQPKGAEIEHKGLTSLVNWHQRVFDVTPEDRATQLAAFSFDSSVWELWSHLTAGASVYIADDETRSSPSRLWQWLARNGITICYLPTPLAVIVLEEPLPQGLALRLFLLGADKLHHPPRQALPFPLVNIYGPTETTVISTWALVDMEADSPPPIGRPVDNTQVYILGRQLHPVPVGVPGELHIGGIGLARGYLRRPDLTNEKFIPNPFSDEPAACLYKTGDLCRYLPDGNIEFLGRTDYQVKIRGFRVELGEIEAVLGQHPAVRGTVVLAREDGPGDKRLVAYVVPTQEPAPTISALRGYLRAKLPEYMIPSAFVFLDALPLMPSGKVDRQALPPPGKTRPGLEHTFVAPRTPVEEVLAGIWSQVLGLEQIGVYDNFFEVGGHSLLATRVVSRIRDAFGVELPLRALFEGSTVTDLAVAITQRLVEEAGHEEMACLLAELDRLSEDDVRPQLDTRRSESSE